MSDKLTVRQFWIILARKWNSKIKKKLDVSLVKVRQTLQLTREHVRFYALAKILSEIIIMSK